VFGLDFFVVLFLDFEKGSCYVAQADLKLVIFLCQPPVCWDYRHVPPCLAAHLPFKPLLKWQQRQCAVMHSV
jgi:hypothetical protein